MTESTTDSAGNLAAGEIVQQGEEPGLITVGEYIREHAEQVNRYLSAMLSTEAVPANLIQAMNYSLLAGGKRIRPLLCLATANAFGVPAKQVMPAAAAIEVLHTYSLIHDDLPSMDNDEMRRGKPTNHMVFGDATALLAGDALLTYAFELLSTPMPVAASRQLEMVRVLSRAAGCYGMVGGQTADVSATQSGGSLQLLEFIHTNKTAKLIQAAVEIGSLFAEISEQQRAALREFGLQIGLAFQIVDDLLDVVGNTEELGKPAGSDERMHKLTYPYLIGVERTKELAQTVLERGIASLIAAEVHAPILVGLARSMTARRS